MSTACAGGAGAGSTVLTLEDFIALTPEPLFMRGDVNWDEEVDMADGMTLLDTLFHFHSRGRPDCPDAADVNDDGLIDISDAAGIFSYRFLGSTPPRPPTLAVGSDPTEDELDCE